MIKRLKIKEFFSSVDYDINIAEIQQPLNPQISP